MIELHTQTPAEAAGTCQTNKLEIADSSKPYGPCEPRVFEASGSQNSTYNPTKEESLGQNQVADIVSARLRDSMAWDPNCGQWYIRPEVGSPFRELDADSSWSRISDQIVLIKRKYTAGFVNGVERFVRAQLTVTGWNSNPHLLPLSNGVFDLKTRTLRDYEDEDRFNWQLPYPYQASATCPTIDEALFRMVGGDPALGRSLDGWLLVVLLGRYDVQSFLELVGDGGTGKSTFLRLLTLLVGDENVRSTDIHSLEHNQFETAALYGKRLTLITDSARYRGEVPVLKAITGGDPIRLERKHQQQRKPFSYHGLVAIAANQPLESSDYSSGLKRRRRALAFNYKVSESEKKKYRDRTKYPTGFEGELSREMPGLLNRLLSLNVEDAVSLIANPDDAMKAQCLDIEFETNPLLAWADERLVKCSPSETETRIGDLNNSPDEGLYSNYCCFIEAIGQRPASMTKFSRALLDTLKSHDITTRKARNAYTYLVGLRLRRIHDDVAGLVSGSKCNHVGLKQKNGVAAGSVGSVSSELSSDFSHDYDQQPRSTSRGGVL